MWDVGRIGLRRGRGELPKSDVRSGKGDGTKAKPITRGRIPTRTGPNTITRRTSCDEVGDIATRESHNGTRARRRNESRGRTHTCPDRP